MKPWKKEEISEKWKNICDEIKSKKVSVGNALDQGIPVIEDENILVIRFKKNHSFQLNMVNKNKIFIEKFFDKHLGKSLHIKTEFDQNSKEEIEIKPKQKSEIINQISESDPILNKLIKELGLELT